MTGRQENKKRIESIIKEMLQDSPYILKRYANSFNNKTHQTKLSYLRNTIDFLEYLKTELNFDIYNTKIYSNIGVEEIDDYMEHIRYKKGGVVEKKEITIATQIFAVSNFFDFLEKARYIEDNPCKRIEKPKSNEESEVVYMTPEEILKLKNNIMKGYGNKRNLVLEDKWKNRDLAIVTLGCATGLRVASISEINISDIDFKENTIKVTEKGNKTRRCKIGNNVADILKQWINDRSEILNGENPNGALFISNRKTRITTRTIANMIERNTKEFDKRITPHKMRASCATNLYEKTGDIYLVQDVLGHKNIANTRRYTKVSDAKREMAADILDRMF